MTLQTSTLRPGLLVSLSTTIRGGVDYSTQTIEAEHTIDGGALKAVWETQKVVADPAEHKRATEARSKARHAVTRVCAQTSFGLLCPEAKRDELSAGIEEAQRIAAEFNRTALYSRIAVYTIAAVIKGDEAETVRAINSEVRGLLEDMERGIRDLDPEAIRKAATAARNVGAMLKPEVAERVQEAIDAARSAARKIVKAGETAAVEVDRLALNKIKSARTEFLEIPDEAPAEVAAPVQTGRAVDLEPEGAAWQREVNQFAASLDLDAPPPTITAATYSAQAQLEL